MNPNPFWYKLNKTSLQPVSKTVKQILDPFQELKKVTQKYDFYHKSTKFIGKEIS